jgi:hypothetical protein
LGIKGPQLNPAHWIYYPEHKFIFYRAGFYCNFSEKPSQYQSVVLEITHRPGLDPKQLDEMADKAVNGFNNTGLLTGNHSIEHISTMKIPYAYVIYDAARRKALPVIMKYLARNGIYSIGRYGRWEYASTEDALRQGIETAKIIAKCR